MQLFHSEMAQVAVQSGVLFYDISTQTKRWGNTFPSFWMCQNTPLKLYDLTHSLKSLKPASHWHALGVVLHCLCIKIDEPRF